LIFLFVCLLFSFLDILKCNLELWTLQCMDNLFISLTVFCSKCRFQLCLGLNRDLLICLYSRFHSTFWKYPHLQYHLDHFHIDSQLPELTCFIPINVSFIVQVAGENLFPVTNYNAYSGNTDMRRPQVLSPTSNRTTLHLMPSVNLWQQVVLFFLSLAILWSYTMKLESYSVIFKCLAWEYYQNGLMKKLIKTKEGKSF
jgi:hypothetical protein